MEYELGYSPALVGTIIDPPEGWMYGFPKVFSPSPGQSFRDWLRANGYPESMLDLGCKCSRFYGGW